MLLVLSGCAQQADEFSILLGGDVMLTRASEPIFANSTSPINPWVELESEEILPKNLVEDDFFLVNLESPLGSTSASTGEMNLCGDPSEVSLLLEGHVSLVSLANNHRDDCQADGEQLTRAVLDENNILSAGTDLVPIFLDAGQGKLAVIAADEVAGSLDVERLLGQVQKVKSEAQIVIVSIHWGNEYQAGPDEHQQELAQQLVDAGADVIWGHHPHVLQRMEWLSSDNGREALVIYSLGNLLSDQYMLEDALRSALVRITYQDTSIDKIEIIPVYMDRAGKILKLAEDEEVKETILDRLRVSELERKNVEIVIR